MARVAVCLAGCGFLDGAEIHEAVCTLLALDRAGAEVLCCAPNVNQSDLIDHLAQKPQSAPPRNVLIESARIARGNIRDIAKVQAKDLDALIIPGGFGAAKNLCSFAFDGPACKVNPEMERLINEMLDSRKPIGAICIAPALLARVTGKRGLKVTLTIGNDRETAQALEKMGARHQDCLVTDCVVDQAARVVSTPAYMLAKGPAEVAEGVARLVAEVLRLAEG